MIKSIGVVVSSFLVSLCLSAGALAAADAYIKIGDIKGESKVVHCPGGTCVLEGMAAGTYEVQVCDEKGQPVKSQVALTQALVTKRDPASGLPTGKRQHKPLSVTKPIDKATPENRAKPIDKATPVLFKLEVLEDGSTVEVKAVNHNSSRSNKTSS